MLLEDPTGLRPLYTPGALVAGATGPRQGGTLQPGSRTEDFTRRVEGRAVHLSPSGRTREFDGNGKREAGR